MIAVADNPTIVLPRSVTYQNMEKFKEWSVIGVTYADPPTPTDEGWVTVPSMWASAAAEKAVGLKCSNVSNSRIVGSCLDEKGGLAIAIEIRLGSLFHLSNWSGNVNMSFTSVCAHVEGYAGRTVWPGKDLLGIVFDLTLLKNAGLFGFDLISGDGGCNPGTMLYFPQAPRFSKKLEAFKKRQSSDFQKRLLTKAPRIKRIPGIDYSCNKILERVRVNN